MSETELKRRKLHGVLSSKSLLESLDNLVLNKQLIEKSKQKLNSKSSRSNQLKPFHFQLFQRTLVIILICQAIWLLTEVKLNQTITLCHWL